MQPGAFAFLKVQLEAGESIKAESDAMMAMSGNIKVEGK
ncbi:AIM24 family protein, partial [Phascolarctobacterium faecium]